MLEYKRALWGHTAVICRMACVAENFLVSAARNGEMIWWDMGSQTEIAFYQYSGPPGGLTTVKDQALCFLLDGRLAEAGEQVPWCEVVPSLPTRVSGHGALLGFAASLVAEGRSGGRGSRASDHNFVELVMSGTKQLNLGRLDSFFLLGGSYFHSFGSLPRILVILILSLSSSLVKVGQNRRYLDGHNPTAKAYWAFTWLPFF